MKLLMMKIHTTERFQSLTGYGPLAKHLRNVGIIWLKLLMAGL